MDLVKLIQTNSDGNAEILFVGDSEPVEFAMSARGLHTAYCANESTDKPLRLFV